MPNNKTDELEKVKRQNKILLKRIADERERISGYEEIAKLYSAYIAILLKKLGANSEDKAVTVRDKEIKCAIADFETRAIPMNEGVWGLYFLERAKNEE